MPQIQWEWKFGPASILGVAQLAVILIGLIGFFNKQQADLTATAATVAELKAITAQMTQAQATVLERVTKVETRVDMIIPSLSRIEARQISGHP